MKIVRTYATSANLGPGFDAFGICLNLYNEYAFEVSNKYEINELVKIKACNKDVELYHAGYF